MLHHPSWIRRLHRWKSVAVLSEAAHSSSSSSSFSYIKWSQTDHLVQNTEREREREIYSNEQLCQLLKCAVKQMRSSFQQEAGSAIQTTLTACQGWFFWAWWHRTPGFTTGRLNCVAKLRQLYANARSEFWFSVFELLNQINHIQSARWIEERLMRVWNARGFLLKCLIN